MTKKQAPQGHHGTDATQDRGMRYGTPLQGIRMDEPDEIQERRPYAHGGYVHAKNSSQSYKASGSVIREAHRGTEGREYHIGGGCKDPNERSLPEHFHDVEAGGKKR